MLDVRHVSKTFAARMALDDVSFHANAGEIIGLVGRNGAGKSTLMRLIAGVLRTDAGQIILAGTPRLGFLPEGAPLYGDLCVRDMLAFGLGAHGYTGQRLRVRLDDVLGTLALRPVAGRVTATLSKGYQRRTALALALAARPDVLILDEPFDGFDPVQKHAASAHLRALAPGRLILLSSHSLNDATRLCNRLIVIEKGRVCADAAPQKLLRDQGETTLDGAFRKLLAGAA